MKRLKHHAVLNGNNLKDDKVEVLRENLHRLIENRVDHRKVHHQVVNQTTIDHRNTIADVDIKAQAVVKQTMTDLLNTMIALRHKDHHKVLQLVKQITIDHRSTIDHHRVALQLVEQDHQLANMNTKKNGNHLQLMVVPLSLIMQVKIEQFHEAKTGKLSFRKPALKECTLVMLSIGKNKNELTKQAADELTSHQVKLNTRDNSKSITKLRDVIKKNREFDKLK